MMTKFQAQFSVDGKAYTDVVGDTQEQVAIALMSEHKLTWAQAQAVVDAAQAGKAMHVHTNRPVDWRKSGSKHAVRTFDPSPTGGDVVADSDRSKAAPRRGGRPAVGQGRKRGRKQADAPTQAQAPADTGAWEQVARTVMGDMGATDLHLTADTLTATQACELVGKAWSDGKDTNPVGVAVKSGRMGRRLKALAEGLLPYVGGDVVTVTWPTTTGQFVEDELTSVFEQAGMRYVVADFGDGLKFAVGKANTDDGWVTMWVELA